MERFEGKQVIFKDGSKEEFDINNSTSAPNACQGGSTSIIFTVEGDCESTTCTASFTVPPASELVAICPDHVVLAACTTFDDITMAYDDWIDAFDFAGGCSASETSVAPDLPVFTCGAGFTLSYTYTVEGSCTMNSCTSMLTLAGAESPTINCPTDFTAADCLDLAALDQAFAAWLNTASIGSTMSCNPTLTNNAYRLPMILPIV